MTRRFKTLQAMNKTMSNSPGYGIKPHTAPGNFELDEIQWDETGYSMHPDFIPFKYGTKIFKKELAELINQHVKDL